MRESGLRSLSRSSTSPAPTSAGPGSPVKRFFSFCVFQLFRNDLFQPTKHASRRDRVQPIEVYVSDEQQLNRSVLEAKKADELKAIAAAVGVSLSGRPTKAGVIDQILNFTGVTVADSNGSSNGNGNGASRAPA